MSQYELTLRMPVRPKLRFGLKFILLLVLVVAIGLGSHRYGDRTGYQRGFGSGYQVGRHEAMSEKLVKESYRVSDMLASLDNIEGGGRQVVAELNGLIEEIVAQVEPASWRSNGGPAKIAIYSQHLSLVVTQTGQGHDKIKTFLEHKRLALGIGPE